MVRLVIEDGKEKTYKHRKKLTDMGFVWGRGCDKDKSAYTLETDDEALIKSAGRFCRKHGLKGYAFEEGWTRSRNYRDAYFSAYKPDRKARYRCAYCGKKTQHVHIDHIVPVRAVEDPATRRKYIKSLKRRGINNINDPGNLTAACKTCNLKKGKKTGAWIIRGRLGKTAWFWPVFHTAVFFIVAISLILFILCYL